MCTRRHARTHACRCVPPPLAIAWVLFLKGRETDVGAPPLMCSGKEEQRKQREESKKWTMHQIFFGV